LLRGNHQRRSGFRKCLAFARLLGSSSVTGDVASDDTASLQAAFDPKWESAVPYTVLLSPGGKVFYQKQGSVDILELRQKILAYLDSDYIGFNKYSSRE
jgi:hypothetical protein